MEPSPSSSSSSPPPARQWSPEVRRVRKRALEEVLEQVQRAVEMLRDADADLGASLADDAAAPPLEGEDRKGRAGDDADDAATSSVASDSDYETAQMCDLLKSKVESLEFLKKLDGIQKSVYQDGAVEPDMSWDIIKAVDLWEDDDPDGGTCLLINFRKPFGRHFQLKRRKVESGRPGMGLKSFIMLLHGVLRLLASTITEHCLQLQLQPFGRPAT
ncbi:unnamed protein product [Urochloa humidicola]